MKNDTKGSMANGGGGGRNHGHENGRSSIHAGAASAAAALSVGTTTTERHSTGNAPTSLSASTGIGMTAVPGEGVHVSPKTTKATKLHSRVLDELKNRRRRSLGATDRAKLFPPGQLNVGTVSHNNQAPSPIPIALVTSPIPSPPISPSKESSDVEDPLSGSATPPEASTPTEKNHGKHRCCTLCDRSFTMFRPRHTCKVCKSRICDDCSKNRVKLNLRLERKKGSRMCDECARTHVAHGSPPSSPALSPLSSPGSGGGVHREARSGRIIGDLNKKGMMNAVEHPNTKRKSSLQNLLSRTFSTGKNLNSLQTNSSSHLRWRHWISFYGLFVVLFVRIVIPTFALDVYQQMDGYISMKLITSACLIIEQMVTLKNMGIYLMVLCMYDEISICFQKKKQEETNTTMEQEPSSSPSLSRKPSVPAGARAEAQLVSGQKQEEEPLEVDTGDKLHGPEEGFNFENLAIALTNCVGENLNKPQQKMTTSSFLHGCDSICGFILVFGKATSFAASTVNGYIGTIATNLDTWPPPSESRSIETWKDQEIRQVIEHEVILQVASVGGKKKPSCCRCILRLLWFIEFVEACIRYCLVESTTEDVSSGATKAYEETIGSRHSWIIRKGVIGALGSMPKRHQIFTALHLLEENEQEISAITRTKVEIVQKQMRQLVDQVYEILKEHDLLDIK